MATPIPFSIFYNYFNDNIPDSDIASIVDDKRLRFLRSSITKFVSGTGKTIIPDYNNESITINTGEITERDKTLVGLMMYKEFLKQEVQKQNKIMSISSDAFKITGANDRVKELQKMKSDADSEISDLLAAYLGGE